MMNKFLTKLFVPLIIGLILFACNSTSSDSDSNSPSEGNAPNNSQPPANSGGQSPAAGNEQKYFQLPLSPSISPTDVIQQITWTGGGAGSDGSSCNSNCFISNQNTISLTYFQPNQRLRIDIFYPTGTQQSGAGVYEFLTELDGQTDNNGTLEIHVDRDTKFFQFIVLDEGGNVVVKPRGIGDIQYTKSSPNCPGNLSSRLAVGMRAQVTYGNPIFLQLNPNSSESGILTILEGETKLTIAAGPQCNEGKVWWQVGAEQSDGVYGGWVAEGDQSSWFIEPLE